MSDTAETSRKRRTSEHIAQDNLDAANERLKRAEERLKAAEDSIADLEAQVTRAKKVRDHAASHPDLPAQDDEGAKKVRDHAASHLDLPEQQPGAENKAEAEPVA